MRGRVLEMSSTEIGTNPAAATCSQRRPARWLKGAAWRARERQAGVGEWWRGLKATCGVPKVVRRGGAASPGEKTMAATNGGGTLFPSEERKKNGGRLVL